MTFAKQHLAELARSSRRTAIISAIGALVVFASLGISGLVMIRTIRNVDELNKQNSLLTTKNNDLLKINVALEGEIADKTARSRSLDEQIKTLTAKRDLAERRTAASEYECDNLKVALTSAATPGELQTLQSEAKENEKETSPEIAAPPRDQSRLQARREWEAGQAVRNKAPASAESHFKKAIQADPTYPAPYNSLGRLKLDNKMPDQAIALYKQALDRSSTYTPAIYNLAIAYKKTGHNREALEYAGLFQKLSSDGVRARKLLAFVSAAHDETPPAPFR